jgi:hypothetical protein
MYAPVYAACSCGCNSNGWFVASTQGWRSQYAVNVVAAQLATNMLNAGRITEEEVNVMWSLDTDWEDLVLVPDDSATIPAHLN